MRRTTESAEVNRETLDLLQNSVIARQKRKMDGLRMPRGIQAMTKPKIVTPAPSPSPVTPALQAGVWTLVQLSKQT